MGDIADMMLEGAMCQECGEYLGEGEGFPTFCASCMRNHPELLSGDEEPRKTKVKCRICDKAVKEVGLRDHMRDAHKFPR